MRQRLAPHSPGKSTKRQKHHYRKALEICRQAVREENVFEVGCLDDLAQLYEAEGKYSDVEPLWKQSLKIATKVMDGKGPLVALCAENLAQLYAA
jgi:hypothetical protein